MSSTSIRWILGILTTLYLAGGGIWASYMARAQDALAEKQGKIEETLGELSRDITRLQEQDRRILGLEERLAREEAWRMTHLDETQAGYQRLSVVESEQKSFYREFAARLQRIEERLDRILESQRVEHRERTTPPTTGPKRPS